MQGVHGSHPGEMLGPETAAPCKTFLGWTRSLFLFRLLIQERLHGYAIIRPIIVPLARAAVQCQGRRGTGKRRHSPFAPAWKPELAGALGAGAGSSWRKIDRVSLGQRKLMTRFSYLGASRPPSFLISHDVLPITGINSKHPLRT